MAAAAATARELERLKETGNAEDETGKAEPEEKTDDTAAVVPERKDSAEEKEEEPVEEADEWEEYEAIDGRPYWYNHVTMQSVWRNPKDIEAEKAATGAAVPKFKGKVDDDDEEMPELEDTRPAGAATEAMAGGTSGGQSSTIKTAPSVAASMAAADAAAKKASATTKGQAEAAAAPATPSTPVKPAKGTTPEATAATAPKDKDNRQPTEIHRRSQSGKGPTWEQFKETLNARTLILYWFVWLTSFAALGHPVAGFGATLVYGLVLKVLLSRCLEGDIFMHWMGDERWVFSQGLGAGSKLHETPQEIATSLSQKANQALRFGRYTDLLHRIRALQDAGINPADILGVDTISKIRRIGTSYMEGVKLLMVRLDMHNWAAYERNEELNLEWGFHLTQRGTILFAMVCEPPLEKKLDFMRVIAGCVEFNSQGMRPLRPEVLKQGGEGNPSEEQREELPPGQGGFVHNLVYAMEVGKDPLDTTWRVIHHNPNGNHKTDGFVRSTLIDALDEPIASIVHVSGRAKAKDLGVDAPPPLENHYRQEFGAFGVESFTPLSEGGRFRYMKVSETDELPRVVRTGLDWAPGFALRSMARAQAESDVRLFFNFIRNSQLLTEIIKSSPRRGLYEEMGKRLHPLMKDGTYEQ